MGLEREQETLLRSILTTAWCTTSLLRGRTSTAATQPSTSTGVGMTKFLTISAPSAGTVKSSASVTTRSGSPSRHPSANTGGSASRTVS